MKEGVGGHSRILVLWRILVPSMHMAELGANEFSFLFIDFEETSENLKAFGKCLEAGCSEP